MKQSITVKKYVMFYFLLEKCLPVLHNMVDKSGNGDTYLIQLEAT